MNMQALGLIETIGLVASIQAADICLKSANVELIGQEITAGQLVTVKIQGDVGAVKSAIDAAKASIEPLNKLHATLVIPRPSLGISSVIAPSDFNEKVEESTITDLSEHKNGENAITTESHQNIEIKSNELDEIKSDELKQAGSLKDLKKNNICNLCNDPTCSRRRGQPKSLCISYTDKIKEFEGDVKDEVR